MSEPGTSALYPDTSSGVHFPAGLWGRCENRAHFTPPEVVLKAGRCGAGSQGKSFHPEEEGLHYRRAAPPMVRPTPGGTSAGVLRGPGRYGAGRQGSARPLSPIHFGCPVSAFEILRGALHGYSVAAASRVSLTERLTPRGGDQGQETLLERFLLGTPLRLASGSLLSLGEEELGVTGTPRVLVSGSFPLEGPLSAVTESL